MGTMTQGGAVTFEETSTGDLSRPDDYCLVLNEDGDAVLLDPSGFVLAGVKGAYDNWDETNDFREAANAFGIHVEDVYDEWTDRHGGYTFSFTWVGMIQFGRMSDGSRCPWAFVENLIHYLSWGACRVS